MRRHIRQFVLSIVAAATLSVAGACQVNPATGRTQFVVISPQAVSQLGDEARPQLTDEYGGEAPEPQLRQYVDRVGRDLAEHVEEPFGEIEWTFTVLDSDVINAFALPGGHVFITRGLMSEFENEAQLAGVLGHEIGHVTGRHIDERISQAMGAQLGLGLLGQLTESQIAMVVGELFVGGYQLSFGRDQESEADRLGVRYMARAGYDPHGMIEVLEVLQRAAAEHAQPPEFLSTHPHPETRIQTVTRLLESEYAHTQDNPDFRKHQERFSSEARPYLSDASPPGSMRPLALGGMCGTCGAAH